MKKMSAKLITLFFLALFTFVATTGFAQTKTAKTLKLEKKPILKNTDVKNLKAVPLESKKTLSKEIQQKEQISARANTATVRINKKTTAIDFNPKLKKAFEQVDADLKAGKITAKQARLKKLEISKVNDAITKAQY